jgi:hypothetical protein
MRIMNEPDWPACFLPVSSTLYEQLSGSQHEFRGTSRGRGGGKECEVSA